VPAIRGLVFDKDGTLFDFHRTWSAWSAALIQDLTGADPARAAVLAEALAFDLENASFLPGSPLIAGTMDVLIEAVAEVLPEVDETYLRELVLAETAAIQPVEAVPLAPLLDRLTAGGLILGVATNDAEAPARAHLASLGILDRFAFVAGYDSGQGGKPAPGMLHAFCRATGLSEAECAMVGDTTHDLTSGRAAGMATVGVLTGHSTRAELDDLADVVLASIAELPAWLSERARDQA
jgi:phosphoglycolate phosphatase